jgi:hypothetical protein
MREEDSTSTPMVLSPFGSKFLANRRESEVAMSMEAGETARMMQLGFEMKEETMSL